MAVAIAFLSLLTACAQQLQAAPTLPSPTAIPPATRSLPTRTTIPSIAPTETPAIAIKPTNTHSPTPRPTLAPDQWMDLPVIPAASDTTRLIYQRGLLLGNDPLAYAKIGDCEATTAWFLSDFDAGPEYYNLGDHEYLAVVIERFHGSHSRVSLAANRGFTAASVLSPLVANPDFCESNETPLACEYRLHRPSLAFIILGTNDARSPDTFEANLRKIIEFSIAQGVVPVLATKADNQEGDHSINATIARLAWEYGIPLWNFWAAVQDLPDGGLQEDGVHLTWAGNFFDKPYNLTRAWPIRNLTALQTLASLWVSLP